MDRVSNSNTSQELRIYESVDTNDPDLLGATYYGGMSYGGIHPYLPNTVNVIDIVLYTTNLRPWTDGMTELQATTMHEVGHALSLAHTNGVDEGERLNAPIGNAISKTYDLMDTLSPANKKNPAFDNVKLIMNQSTNSDFITDVDKSHLIIKWGT